MIGAAEANLILKETPLAGRRRSPIPMWGESFRCLSTLPMKETLVKYPEAFNEQTKEHCLQINSIEIMESKKMEKHMQSSSSSLTNSINDDFLDEIEKNLSPKPHVILRRQTGYDFRIKLFREFDEAIDKLEFCLESSRKTSVLDNFPQKWKCQMQILQDDEKESTSKIKAVLLKKEESNVLVVGLYLPADMPTGFWHMRICTMIIAKTTKHVIISNLELPDTEKYNEIDNVVSVIEDMYII